MSEHQDKVPPVTDDVDIEVLQEESTHKCDGCGQDLPKDTRVGRCPGCGKLFMQPTSLS
jgi:Zn finger protein HypA/HybF involved in hydrogenase expression